MTKRLFPILIFLISVLQVTAQVNGNFPEPNQFSGETTDRNSNRYTWGRDSTHTQKTDIPEGFYQFTVDDKLGDITIVESDSTMHGFQNSNNSDGYTGEYTILGSQGSPRFSRIFFNRPFINDAYNIARQYSFVRPEISEFHFWNTKSPITNLSYHSAGDKELGDDRFRAAFGTNINKRAGLGFLIDYSYSRGYYGNQANSLLAGTLYGYYHGDKYQINAVVNANHFKTSENGGITDDKYITDPSSFDRNFESNAIPVNLQQHWNRNDDQQYFLTHRFNVGFYRDKELPDSIDLDSLTRVDSLYTISQEFIPVTSFIHTFEIRHLKHLTYGYRNIPGYFHDKIYGNAEDMRDEFNNLNIRNTIGISLCEGFNKWVPASLTAYITHDYNRYHLPSIPYADLLHPQEKDVENDIYVGGRLARTQGRALHFNAFGEIAVIGDNIGSFNVDGNVSLQFPMLRDTCYVTVHGFIKNLRPEYTKRHWHSQHAWWDKDLNNELRTRVEGIFNVKRTHTRLRAGFENIANYTYLQTTLHGNNDGIISRSYDVLQSGSSIQVISVGLNQDFRLGILNWENEITWQQSTSDNILPLPALNIYTNLYLSFRLLKYLRINLGADMRFWTKYYAPDYSPVLNQYTAQDGNHHISVGGHPIINAYANVQFKRIRIYVSGQHVNAGRSAGFWSPHNPISPMRIQFGLSWNFVN